MVEPTNTLIYEVLKTIQAKLETHDKRFDDLHQQIAHVQTGLQEQITRTHEQFHEAFSSLKNQVHELQGDVLRVHRIIGNMDTRLERLERRTGLADA